MNAAAPSIKLACRNVWKVYGRRPAYYFDSRGYIIEPGVLAERLRSEAHLPAVVDATFEVATGEIFVIMGLSGSGKSTLVRCLSRLVEPSAGEILLDGRDLLKATGKELIELRRHAMGMVFQNFGLLPHLTILGNVAFPLKIQGKPVKEREARAREMIALVGLEGREGSFPHQLSGGQQQRVGIARAVAMGPKILLLDEITSALDPELVGEVLEVVRSLAEDGMTMVMVTHEMAFARDASSRIVFMADGGVGAVGPPKEILAADADNERLRNFLARFRASHF
jgi:glycine betaine/proline transport system ATP-binding protein